MINKIPCSKCECPDTPKYVRKRKQNLTGKRGSRIKTKTIYSFCILCHREDQRIRDTRIYEKKLAYNREWRKKNREKVNKWNRKWYNKKVMCF